MVPSWLISYSRGVNKTLVLFPRPLLFYMLKRQKEPEPASQSLKKNQKLFYKNQTPPILTVYSLNPSLYSLFVCEKQKKKNVFGDSESSALWLHSEHV